MENKENPKSELTSYQVKEIERIQKDATQKAQWRQEIEESESLQNFFKDYQPYSVKSFIDHLISQKSLWYNFGDFYERNNESEALQWETAAFEQLAIIQQKKLFDTQCLWRAEKLMLKEVEICFDFKMWEQNILNCRFIDPVSEDDIELYTQYLCQENVELEEQCFLDGWQDYEEIKEAYESDGSNRNFPEWYDFHNGRKGLGVLVQLPDVRGEKEKFYTSLYFSSIKEETQAKQAEWEKKRDKRPTIEYYRNNFFEWFINTFESKRTQQLYKAYTWGNRNRDAEERIMENVNLLLTAEEYVPIEGHHNWIEALEKATQRFRQKKVAEALPAAWERYMINIQTGIEFPNEERSWESIRKSYVDHILKGRVLNGEPEDLIF